MTNLMRVTLATAAVAAALFFQVPASRAYFGDGPWCALTDTGFNNIEEDCTYRSIEACRRNVIAGNRGFCNPNPRWRGRNTPAGARKAHRKHKAHRK
jgi:hypothetical protein